MLKEISFEKLLELPSKELIDFKTILNLAIAEKQEKDKLEARAKLEQVALESGFTLEELVSLKPAKKSAPALYRNPDNKSQTWAGRGRKPNWLLSALESGKSLDDFKVGKIYHPFRFYPALKLKKTYLEATKNVFR